MLKIINYLFPIMLLTPLISHGEEPASRSASITEEAAISKTQEYLRTTGRDKYWEIEEVEITLRDKGKYEGKIWDLKFPSKKNISGSEEPATRMVRMMPFLMWVFIDSGKMYYNEFKFENGKILVIGTPAKLETK